VKISQNFVAFSEYLNFKVDCSLDESANKIKAKCYSTPPSD
jgi:hypothetical protein